MFIFAEDMMTDRKYDTLVLVTDSFPFGGVTEGSFVLPELPELSRVFKRVIIMPTIAVESQQEYDLPKNVEISTFWIDYPDWKHRWRRSRYIFSPKVWSAIAGNRSYSSLTFAVAAQTFSKAVSHWVKQEKLKWGTTLFYTFWFDLATAGLAMTACEFPVNYISRAHEHDIYNDRSLALRAKTAVCSKGIFTAGKAGADYMKRCFHLAADRIQVRRLGSGKPDYEFLSRHHKLNERRLTFLSVARVEPVKRVDLNYKMLRALAIARESYDIRWIHIGDGSLLPSLREIVACDCPPNLHVELVGAMQNDQVHDLYREETIDWVMLLSEREGLPVALCEALSYGVPVVTTMVPGNDEAVDDDCAVILARDPEPEEFVRGMLPYCDSQLRYDAMSDNAFRRWKELFDSRSLRRSFAEEIMNL